MAFVTCTTDNCEDLGTWLVASVAPVTITRTIRAPLYLTLTMSKLPHTPLFILLTTHHSQSDLTAICRQHCSG